MRVPRPSLNSIEREREREKGKKEEPKGRGRDMDWVGREELSWAVGRRESGERDGRWGARPSQRLLRRTLVLIRKGVRRGLTCSRGRL